MTQYVKITKCQFTEECWYHDRVGQVFPIEHTSQGGDVYPIYREDRGKVMHYIAAADCEPFQFTPLPEDQHLITTEQLNTLYGMGKEGYSESIANKIAEMFPQVFTPAKTTYKIGERFVVESETYILANSEFDKVTLICLTDGMRYDNAEEVHDLYHITEQEMKKLTNRREFTLLPDSTDQAV